MPTKLSSKKKNVNLKKSLRKKNYKLKAGANVEGRTKPISKQHLEYLESLETTKPISKQYFKHLESLETTKPHYKLFEKLNDLLNKLTSDQSYKELGGLVNEILSTHDIDLESVGDLLGNIYNHLLTVPDVKFKELRQKIEPYIQSPQL